MVKVSRCASLLWFYLAICDNREGAVPKVTFQLARMLKLDDLYKNFPAIDNLYKNSSHTIKNNNSSHTKTIKVF